MLVLMGAASAWGETELGAPLPDSARKVAEHRYRSSTDWEGTFKYYRSALPSSVYPRRDIARIPGVKAVHIANPSGKGEWEGLNIYHANDEVRIYVVPRSGKSAVKKKK